MVAKIRGMNVSTTAAPITGPTTAVLWKVRRIWRRRRRKEKRRRELCYDSSLQKSLISSNFGRCTCPQL